MCTETALNGLDGDAVAKLLQGAVAQGRDPARILRDAGIAPAALGAADATIDGAALVRLVRQIQLSLDDVYLGFLSPGCRLALDTERLLSILSCSTLGEALRVSIRFTNAMSPDVGPAITEQHHTGLQHVCRYQTIEGVDRDILVWIRFVWIFHFFSWLIGRPLALRGLSIRGPRPQQINGFDRFALFGCPVAFDAPFDALSYDWADLSEPLRQRSIDDYNAYYAGAPDWLESPNKGASWRERTRLALIEAQRACAWAPTVEAVAAQLRTAPRRLRRGLQQEGESFQTLRTRLRGETAGAYLLASDIPITEIGFMVGYTDPASFSRQFSAWAGMAPSTYRNRFITDPDKLTSATTVLSERRIA